MASNPGIHANFVPFTIPVWGFVEKNHIHVDNHMNYVFHVDSGFIIGAAAYPVRDHFQETQKGSILNMHGAVRWFKKHGYEPFFGSLAATFWEGFKTSFLQIFILVALVFVIVFNAFIVVYWVYLKPRIESKIGAKKPAANPQNPKAIVQLPPTAATNNTKEGEEATPPAEQHQRQPLRPSLPTTPPLPQEKEEGGEP